MTTLYFDLPAALRLAEHAAAAPGHSRSLTEHDDGVTCPGALLWVADAGVYLMSGGEPGLRVDPDDPASSHDIVYADGWTDDEGTSHDRYHSAIGGDDFVEHLHLHDVYSSSHDGRHQRTLLQAMRVAAAHGYCALVIDVHDADTYTIWLSQTGPQ